VEKQTNDGKLNEVGGYKGRQKVVSLLEVKLQENTRKLETENRSGMKPLYAV